MGGGIGVPPMLETMKQLDAKKIAVLGYRDELFLNEEFEKMVRYTLQQKTALPEQRNVMDAIRENDLEADVIFACGPKPRSSRHQGLCTGEEESPAGFPWKSTWLVESVPALAVYASPQKRMPILMYTISAVCKDGPVFRSTEVEL